MDFLGRSSNGFGNGFGMSQKEALLRSILFSCDDEDDEEDYDDEDMMSSCSSVSEFTESDMDYLRLQDKLQAEMHKNKEMEANKNAESLIAEEEKQRKKAEKRRAKKKKRKEKKRQQREKENKSEGTSKDANLSQEQNAEEKSSSSTKSASDIEEEALDLASAFVAMTLGKKKSLADAKAKRLANKQAESATNQLSPEDCIHQGRAYAKKGYEYANKESHREAIYYFSEAIKMDPADYRYFGNRSYCYARLGNYERALKDANRAIQLRAEWPKGHFRKGVALKGLKKYMEAEKSFREVLKLDKDCQDAVEELFSLQINQIAEMGFSTAKAESALRHCGSVSAALEFLLSDSPKVDANKNLEVYISDDDDEFYSSPFSPELVSELTKNPADEKMDPRNPEGLTSLWVGNIKPEVPEKALKTLFSKYGELIGVRLLPERFCAFVNYKDKYAAGRAMAALQGKELCGQGILIRYPDNPLTTNGVMMLKKKKAGTMNSENKPTQPVNGDECFYWRTTGCAYGERCRYKHIPKHKGIDRRT